MSDAPSSTSSRSCDAKASRYQMFAKDPQRPNLVARIKGNGKKRPILVMGHTDVVSVDPQKWSFPPFGATRDGGYVYGRGAVDDKDSVVAGLMLMLTLKRTGTALDRDVIFLAESGEEGAPEFGAQFMIDNHFDAIDAEYCFAEGGGVARSGGRVTQATVGTTEKEPRPIQLIAHGTSGHGSVPLKDNAIARLSSALAKIAAWVPPLQLSETTDRLLQDAGDCRAAGDGATVPRRAEHQSESRSRQPPSGCSRTSRSTGRCCTRRSSRRSSMAAIATT